MARKVANSAGGVKSEFERPSIGYDLNFDPNRKFLLPDLHFYRRDRLVLPSMEYTPIAEGHPSFIQAGGRKDSLSLVIIPVRYGWRRYRPVLSLSDSLTDETLKRFHSARITSIVACRGGA